MNKIKRMIVGALIFAGLAATPLAIATPAFAAVNPQEQACIGTGGSWNGNACTKAGQANLTQVVKTIVNVLLYVIGVIAVVVIIIGGIRYTTSGGNAASVSAAKNTILYAVIGLVVALLAYAIVNFVIGVF